jgi:hypothetical protein
MVRPTALFGTPTLAKLLHWAPSLLTVAVMVETVSLRPPKGLVPVVPVVVAVCTMNSVLLERQVRDLPVEMLKRVDSSSPVVVVVLAAQVATAPLPRVEMVALVWPLTFLAPAQPMHGVDPVPET